MSTDISGKPARKKRVRDDERVTEVNEEEDEGADYVNERPRRRRRSSSQETQGDLVIQRSIVRACAVCLSLLFLLTAVRTVDKTIDYHSANRHSAEPKTDTNLTTLDNNPPKTNCNALKTDYDALKTNQDALTQENAQLKTEKNQLTTNYDTLMREKNQLQSEVNQLKGQTAEKSCSSGWKKFGCSCYYRTTERKSWQQSREYCQSQGADLVSINSGEEQAFIRGLRTGGYDGSHIGLKRAGGTWTWVDGTPLTTQYWGSGNPRNDENRNCAVYAHYTDPGTWFNMVCSDTRPSICEK